jgi:hypothetical protein
MGLSVHNNIIPNITMSKKHFIELAKILAENPAHFTETAKLKIADFCVKQNSMFDRAKFLLAAGVKP